MRNKAWMFWLLAALLLLLCACGGSQEEAESVQEAAPAAALEPVSQPEPEPAPEPKPEPEPEDPFAVTDYFGNVTVSPAEAADCELVSNDGNTCVFQTSLSLEEFTQRMLETYPCVEDPYCRSPWETEDCVFLSFYEDISNISYSWPTATFLLLECGENLLLNNETAALVLEGTTTVQIPFAWEYLAFFHDPREPLRAGTVYALIQEFQYYIYYGDFNRSVTQVNNQYNFIVPCGDHTVLYNFSLDKEAKSLTLSEYAPIIPQWAGSLRETVDQAVAQVQAAQPALTVVRLTLDGDAMILRLEELDGGIFPAYEELRFDYQSMGLTREETAQALGTLSLPELRSIWAYDWPLENLDPLAGFSALEELRLSSGYGLEGERGGLSDISALSAIEGLRTFAAVGYSISDISALAASSQSLYGLLLSDNLIEDVSPLADCKQLRYVYMDNNLVRDASPLTRLVTHEGEGISILYLRNNPLEQISEMNLPVLENGMGGPEDEMTITFEGTDFAEYGFHYGYPD